MKSSEDFNGIIVADTTWVHMKIRVGNADLRTVIIVTFILLAIN